MGVATVVRFTSARMLRAVLPLLLSAPALAAPHYSFYDYPGAIATLFLGLNDRGVAVGFTPLNSPEISFYFDIHRHVFTPIANIPGFDETEVWNVNDAGTTVGIAHADDYSTESAFFRDSDGNVTLLPHPGLPYSEAQGINDAGDVVGEAWNADWSQAVGYLYRPADGSFTDFLPSPDTEVHGINNKGEVVGSVQLDAGAAYKNSPAGGYGFYRSRNGAITFFLVDGMGPVPRSINDEGIVSGEIFEADGTIKGFVVAFDDANCVPGTAHFRAVHTSLIVAPGQVSTLVQAVTDRGETAGVVVDASGGTHGFVATP